MIILSAISQPNCSPKQDSYNAFGCLDAQLCSVLCQWSGNYCISGISFVHLWGAFHLTNIVWLPVSVIRYSKNYQTVE